MYNRYIPQSDGTYRRNRMQDPGRQNGPSQQSAPPPPRPQTPPPGPKPVAIRPEGFLRQLLPRDFDMEDLLVVLLLLLMAGEADSENALLTLALYLFL